MREIDMEEECCNKCDDKGDTQGYIQTPACDCDNHS